MDRNIYRLGWRRFTPRYLRQVGYRGRLLMLLGIAWALTGVSVLTDSTTVAAGRSVMLMHEHIPMEIRGALWLISGIIAILIAWRPPGYNDALAWLMLYIPPAMRFVSYLVAWLDSLVPFGTDGWPNGWVSAIIYAVMCGVVYVCSDWPDPPRTPEQITDSRHRE